MKDIDFDELDRAVTSLLGKPSGGGVSQPPKAPSAPSQPEPQRATQQQPQAQQASSVTPAMSQDKPQTPVSQMVQPKATPSESRPTESQSPVSQMQIAKPAVTALQKPMPKPSTVAKPEELSVNNTKFPISPAAPSRVEKPAAPAVRAAGVGSQQSQGIQNRRPSGRFMDFVQPSSGNGGRPVQSLASAKQSPLNSANTAGDVKKTDFVAKEPETLPKQAPVQSHPQQPQMQNPLANRPSRASHVGKSVTPPGETSRSLDDLVPRKPRTEDTTPLATDEKSVKPSFVGSLLGKKNDEPLLEEKVASHPEIKSTRKQTEDIPSPFLTDTKVAKRPLGSAVKPAASLRTFAAEESVDKTVSAPKDEVNEQLAPKPTSLPPELGQDIVAVEARDPHATSRPDTPPAYPPEKEAPSLSQKKPVTTVNSASQAAHTATLSIPQQYKAKQATPDKTPRSIYDTEEYHTPLPTAAAKKRKSHPVVWVFVVVLLLALGAGLGVAVYFLFG